MNKIVITVNKDGVVNSKAIYMESEHLKRAERCWPEGLSPYRVIEENDIAKYDAEIFSNLKPNPINKSNKKIK